MRIAWFTPLSHVTGIARFSQAVLHELAQRAHVEVWAEQRADDLEVECCAVHPLSDPPQAAADTRDFDLRVYNLGNNPEFHGAIYRTYESAPGLVILHDKVMQNFFYTSGEDRYLRLMRYFYGADGTRAAARALEDTRLLGDPEFVERYPLVEPCLWNAEGALAHSAHSAKTVAERYGDLVPVTSSHLPLCRLGGLPADVASRAELGVPSERLLVVATGRIGRGKRIEAVVEAFAASSMLRERCTFVAVGGAEVDYLAELEALVDASSLEGVVRFVTEADDRLLHGYLAAADICVNLRYPSTESSSASLVEQLYHGKPVIVYDIGIYAETPGDIVLHVDPAEGPAGVQRALERLVRAPEERVERGARALAYAVEHASVEAYVTRLLSSAEAVVANRPRLRAIDEAADKLTSHRTLHALRQAAARAAQSLAK